MDVVSNLSASNCSSIFFNGPSELIDALVSLQDGFYLPTANNEEAGAKMAQMIDIAKYREGLLTENTSAENIFCEIHYRLLEEKNKHLREIQLSLGGLSDEMIERHLHVICMDKVNEVNLFFKIQSISFFSLLRLLCVFTVCSV